MGRSSRREPALLAFFVTIVSSAREGGGWVLLAFETLSPLARGDGKRHDPPARIRLFVGLFRLYADR
jgi:hypothetical protein